LESRTGRNESRKTESGGDLQNWGGVRKGNAIPGRLTFSAGNPLQKTGTGLREAQRDQENNSACWKKNLNFREPRGPK